MAEIVNTTMFTNGVVSSGVPDLLQRAFQQVVDEEDNENDFVAFLQSDGDESHTIHLTPAQAAALGLTFEVDPVEEAVEEKPGLSHDQSMAIDEVQESTDAKDSHGAKDNIKIEQMDFHSESPQEVIEIASLQPANSCSVQGTVKLEQASCQGWTESEETNVSVEVTNSPKTVDHVKNGVRGNNARILQNLNMQRDLLVKDKTNNAYTDEISLVNGSESSTQYSFEGNQIRTQQVASIQNCQAQILQKLPMILPSSQFVLKPAQTVLKPTRNIRILPNTSKINGAAGNTMNAVHSINNASQNTILFPKVSLLNALSSQIGKSTPLTTQLLNANGISTQLLNASQILTSSNEIPSQVLSTSQIATSVVNSTPVSTQNVLNAQICLSSPVLKPTHTLVQRRKTQQFLTPIMKSTPITSPVMKSSQILSDTELKSAPILKPVQIPAQILRTVPTPVPKNSIVTSNLAKSPICGAPTVFRTASIVKPAVQDLKVATTCSASVLRPTQMVSTSVSILKPQSKVALSNPSNQNVMLNTQNVASFAGTLQTATLTQSAMSNQQSEIDTSKPVQNGKIRQNVLTNGAASLVAKKSKTGVVQKAAAVPTEKTDTSKPLGSSENPIQIVQQGHTFHSMQRLTQSQLKQIAHVLTQRSQEAAMPNEKIVYRVVFPEELDLRIRNPVNLLRGRGGKRGRPKKNAVRPTVVPPKPPVVPEEEQDELKDERKKVIARTRSGRLSRPPRHMMRDYKHLHHLDFMQPDLDDSDGGYSDYNTNSDKLEDEESPKELLSGLEVPKRKISDHFKCPTCYKIYLGRTRMARHFEMHPDHGSPEQLPPSTPEPEIKQTPLQDPLKRKGKKRGPWAYVTPEAKSERRQMKLKEAISVCENVEIINIAAKPVLDALSLFELLVLKSENNVRNFLEELKEVIVKVREKAGNMLNAACDEDGPSEDVIELNEDLLCDALGLSPGLYRINNSVFDQPRETSTVSTEEPTLKRQRIENSEEGKENIDERMSSGFSENSDLSVSDFLNERKTDPSTNPNCPEVLTALTLMPRNPSPANITEANKADNISKLLNQISENPGFQKIDIGTSKISGFQKIQPMNQGFTKLGENLDSSCTQVFTKLDGNFQQPKLERLDQTFIKLEPSDQDFVGLETGTVGSFHKQESRNFSKMPNGFESMEINSQNFAKGFQKLEPPRNHKIEITNSISKIVPMTSSDLTCMKSQCTVSENNSSKMLLITSISKISESLPILQDPVPVISSTCDSSIFGSTENLDMSKITDYNHITHLDILNTSGVIDKNLMIDEKLVEQLHLVDQSSLVDELVSERLKNIPDFSVQISNGPAMPDNILENNLISNNSNLDPDLDFEALSEEFNRNTRS